MAHSHSEKALPRGASAVPHLPVERAAMVQSRATGEVILVDGSQSPFAKSSAHFVAGGIAGMTAAAFTAPLDVLKTRLQSDFYQAQVRTSRAAHVATLNPLRASAHHLSETMQILASVYRLEGPRALFKGLGPNLVGVVPARSIHFYTYGNGKRLVAEHLNNGREAAWVHLTAGTMAGVATSTATNPIWVVKTRLQLDKNVAEQSDGVAKRRYRNSWDCIRQIVREQGFKGLYKGMSASYLGVIESTMQWVMYEQMKKSLAAREERIVGSGRPKTVWDKAVDWTGKVFSAGGAKLIAAVATYPHEVARTRLRQVPMGNGQLKYTGLIQCFRLVWVEEGLAGLYGGMTPHLMRTVPSAAIMFGMYEAIVHLLGSRA